MAVNSKGLGRGLGALFQDEAGPVAGEVQTLALSLLTPNPKQPRREFDETSLQGLADSIRAQGVLQPILVRSMGENSQSHYEIVAGERRWRASKLAGLKEVPVIIKDLSNQEVLAVALVENLQREDLNPLEEAEGIQQLKDEFGLNQEDLARALGKSRSAIANSLRLMNLGEEERKALKEGRISAGHGRALLSLENTEERNELLLRILKEGLNVRETEGAAAIKKGTEPGADETVTVAKLAVQSKGSTVSSGNHLPQSAVMLDLQSRMAKSIRLPVKFSGKESKGRISISYSSREELTSLLHLVGVEAVF